MLPSSYLHINNIPMVSGGRTYTAMAWCCGKLSLGRSLGMILTRCRIHEPKTRDSKRCGSTMDFTYPRLLVQHGPATPMSTNNHATSVPDEPPTSPAAEPTPPA
ncbi:hypothetical protein L1987_84542 [Smallanthus sonchifolius]|uniref:Uncharacterized protein n=1 Tax=Smallanthus sonchifolius TaxID=185202 RepID=A0ACB8YJ84_9ASTR|nr:hypothetical protein L1987_84542 [Smallanthus sonchifolius]